MNRLALAVAFALALPAICVADDKAVADFYAKRTLTIAVGFSAGGNYDVYARLVSRHIGKHIPGNPHVIVQNQPGAGSRRLTNTLANVGPHDGTIIGLPNQGIAMDQALGTPGVKFDARKFNWVGSPTEDNNVFWAWHTYPVKTIEEAQQKEFVVGATGPGSPTTFYPRIMNTLLGTRFKVVSGYPGSSQLDLAIEKGEVGGRVVSWTGLKLTSNWVATGKTNVMLQFGLRKSPELPNVRMLQDLAKTPKHREIFEFLCLVPAMGRPFFLPAGVPAERVAAIRKAFAATMKDPAFVDEARRAKLSVEPLTADHLTQIVGRMFAAPDDVRAVGKAAMQ
ncbi:MAG: Bug family tripartite tricarboxylate transporter substrate binding protein [Xanthobacteraceae bacterium]